MKIEIDEEVVNLLSQLIRRRKNEFFKITHGNSSFSDFNSQVIPEEDSVLGYFLDDNQPVVISLNEEDKLLLEKAKDILGASECTNYIIYRPNTFMAWHTNSNLPGTRIYYTFNLGTGIFRYTQDDKIVDDYDNKKWTARSFSVSKESLFWHTIWTDSTRFSFGFRK